MIERRHVLVLLAAGGLLAACGGGDGEAEPTTVVTSAPAPTSEAPTTTAEPTTTPAPTTTAEPTTTPAPTTTPPTTAPPTTTTDDVIAQVTAAMEDYYDFYWSCLRSPSTCDPSRVAVDGSDALNALTRTRDELASAEFFVGEEPQGYMVIESVEVKSDHVLATTCWWSTAVLYGPPAPDGTPVVQNDTNGSSRETYQFVRDDAGDWKIRRGDVTDSVSEENLCAPLE